MSFRPKAKLTLSPRKKRAGRGDFPPSVTPLGYGRSLLCGRRRGFSPNGVNLSPVGARRRAVQTWPRAVPGEREAPLNRGREGGRYNLDLAQTFVAAAFAAANDCHASDPGQSPGPRL